MPCQLNHTDDMMTWEMLAPYVSASFASTTDILAVLSLLKESLITV